MRRAALIGLLFLPFLFPLPSFAETWAERLGWKASERVLILYADHGGAAYEFNRPAQALLSEDEESRIVRSAGVMVPCPWFHQYARWCRENPGRDVGVCLTMTNPTNIYRWRPISSRDDVTSLVDTDGYFCHSLVQVALRADVREVEREVGAQIERARAAGIHPTHLIPLEASLLTRRDLLEVYLRTAVRYWIPAVMIELTPTEIERIRAEGFPLTDEMIDVIGRYPLPKLDRLVEIPDVEVSRGYAGKTGAFRKLVRGLPPGLTQIIFHPADETEALKLISPGDRWQNQVWEAQLLQDPAVRRLLMEEGVVVTDWLEVMRRFENRQQVNR